MRRSLAMGATWLAIGSGAAALAPAAGLTLAPEAGVSLQPVSRRRPSHSMLKAQLDPQSLADRVRPHELPTQPPPSRSPRRGVGEQLRRWGASAPWEEQLRAWEEPGGDICTGIKPIYEGPARNWKDCRAKCQLPCRYWSYGLFASPHWCRLTADCAYPGVSAYSGRARDVEDGAGLDKRQASVTPEPQEAAVMEAKAAVPEAKEMEVQPLPPSRQTCSPQGSARRFVVSPEIGGWHDIGTVQHYADCASAVASMGYRSLVWGTGSKAKGRCYGFADDVPEVFERSCEDTPPLLLQAASSTAGIDSRALSERSRFFDCWLFGPTCAESGVPLGFFDG